MSSTDNVMPFDEAKREQRWAKVNKLGGAAIAETVADLRHKGFSELEISHCLEAAARELYDSATGAA